MFLDVYRFSFEWEILDWFNKIDNPVFYYFFNLISQFGGSVVVLIIMTIVYWCINKEKGVKIAFISTFTILLNGILKGFVSAKRPFQYENKEYLEQSKNYSFLSDGASGTSFPSGHSQNSVALFSAIIKFFKEKKWVVISSTILAILIPISRLYLGVHFPGDVLVGSLLGLITAIVGGWIIDKFYHKRYMIFIITAIIFIPFLFIPSMTKNIFKGMGILLGCLIGLFLEEKYVNFEIAKAKKVNVIRYIFGIAVTGIIYLGTHVINHLDVVLNNDILLKLSNLFTHAVIALVAIAFVPYLFKKIPFLKDK